MVPAIHDRCKQRGFLSPFRLYVLDAALMESLRSLSFRMLLRDDGVNELGAVRQGVLARWSVAIQGLVFRTRPKSYGHLYETPSAQGLLTET